MCRSMTDPIGRYLKANPEDSQSRLALRSRLAPSLVCDVRKGRKRGFGEDAIKRLVKAMAGKPGAASAAELEAYRRRAGPRLRSA
jgi:hypothetical protein